MGRNNLFDYGGVACHVYLELKYKNLDVSRVRLVWNKLIQTHDMLRTVVFEEGYQQVLKEVPELEIPYWDVSKGENICEYNDFRQQMGNHVYDTGKWPMFGIAIAKKAEESILHFSMDFLIADWTSIWMLLSEFEALYYLKKDSINVPQITFRDYLSAERKLKESKRYVNDKRYWEKRIAYLPDAPELPTLSAEDVKKNFTRKLLCLDSERWNSFKDAAKKLGITPSTAILTAYSDVIAKWSCNKSFCINLTVLNRFPLHDDVTDIVGDFTTLNLLEINANDGNNFAERARKINERLFIDLDHRLFGGVEVIRELSKQRNKRVFMPIVYTSAIGLADQNRQITGKFDGGITQTPQVFIDCQAMDGDFGLQINWDVREGVFPDGMIDDMFDLFQQRIEELAKDETDWNKINGLFLPQWQADERNVANHTETDLPIHLLQSGFMEWAQKAPDRVAVTDGEKKLTYDKLGNVSTLEYIKLNADEFANIMSGKTDPVSLLYPDGSNKYTQALYVENTATKYINASICKIIKKVQKRVPGQKIKILEVGAGTGATTEWVFKALEGSEFEYCFTDISKYFFPDAVNRFGKNPNVTIKKLDLNEDFVAQGFCPNSYDVIIGAYVLNNVKDIVKTINKLKELVRNEGYLIFSETILPETWLLVSQALMMTPPEDTLRDGAAFISKDLWCGVLKESDGVEESVLSIPSNNNPTSLLGAGLFSVC